MFDLQPLPVNRHNEISFEISKIFVSFLVEENTSEHMLHILGPSRFDSIGAIVGDQSALPRLRHAISDAINSGTGGAFLFQSDGEGYALAVVQATDMSPVFTTYAGETAPQRSERETVSLRGLPRFLAAIQKAQPAAPTHSDIPRFLVCKV